MESRSAGKVTDDEVLRLAREVADRLMESAGDAAVKADLADGAPGVALALRYAAEVFDDDRYFKAGQLQLRRTAEASAAAPLNAPGLYLGTAGVVWAVTEYARLEPRYLPTLATMTDRLARQTLAITLHTAAGSVASHDYDVIAGAAGWLAALLKAADVLGGRATDAAREATGRLVDYLVDLTQDDGGKLRWFCAPSHFPSIPGPDGQPTPLPGYVKNFPDGVYNLGFAHGPAGILAALCRPDTAHAAGLVRVDARPHRVRQGIRDLAQTLGALRIDGLDYPAWANLLLPHPDSGRPDTDSPQVPARSAWCYGAPGVAASLLPASAACGDPEPTDLAVATLLGVERTPAEHQRINSPTLCHGLAGLLTVYGRAAAQTGVPDLWRMHDEFLSQLCSYADPDHPYLFPDYDPWGGQEHNPGLLNGAAGVLLALLGAVSDAAAEWDELLFLTPRLPRGHEPGGTEAGTRPDRGMGET
ncbi:lanthionine synthetase C family protein [Streptomyces sp. NBC_01795]|uniref:lanthionine synthetase C family protein n=1 Tax=unclassified Streptomyces TaxID=2593676 RepID=UPI002DDB8865|nr:MULTISPECIES: lanthionine synthetase C family protein [unclassified Streptomyces]WSA92618.1 lanthionine synthetase C family protein [Streptomyces sp. NBC_01795]WSB76984.1 lanthionine synthetase C family protein [Streptomyces sp. NBC_01775]